MELKQEEEQELVSALDEAACAVSGMTHVLSMSCDYGSWIDKAIKSLEKALDTLKGMRYEETSKTIMAKTNGN